MAKGKHSSSEFLAKALPSMMKGMILSVFPIPMKVSTSLFTHSDLAERGVQMTIKCFDCSKAS